jgi:hypothetical protein
VTCSGSSNAGAIVGGVIGGILLITLMVHGWHWCRSKFE